MVIALPEVIVDGSTGHDGHHDVIHHALNSGQLNQGTFLGPNPWIDITHPDVGAVVGSDAYAPVQSALDRLTTGGVIFIPLGEFEKMSGTGWIIKGHGVSFIGCGTSDVLQGSTLSTSSGDMFLTVDERYRAKFSTLALVSKTGGGHIFNGGGTGSISQWQWDHVDLIQQNAAKSIFTGFATFSQCTWSNFSMSGPASASVAQFSVSAIDLANNTWSDGTVHCSPTASTWFFDLDFSGGSSAATSPIRFRDIIFETPNGGMIRTRGIDHVTIDGVEAWDLTGNLANDMIYLGTGSGGRTFHLAEIVGYARYGGSLNSHYDVNMQAGSGAGQVVLRDFGANAVAVNAPVSAVVAINSVGITWSNQLVDLVEVGYSSQTAVAGVFVGGVGITAHDGSPEGAVTGAPGTLCVDRTTGFLYRKLRATGTDTTGWFPVPAGQYDGGTWNIPSTLTGAASSQTFSVVSANLGDIVHASLDIALPASTFLVAQVTASNTITATFVNMSGSTQDPGSASIHFLIFRPE
jgi:hypothetical protein